MNITIDGVTYKAAYPVGATLTHEGGLNQASVQIRHISKLDPFTPFTDVQFLDEWWCIAHDEVTKERYIGKATHNITLVEITKRLERVICGAKTFSRPIMVESAESVAYSVTPTYIQATWYEGNAAGDIADYEENTVTKDDLYYIPAESGEEEEDYVALPIYNNYKDSFEIPSFTVCELKGNKLTRPFKSYSCYIGTSMYDGYRQVNIGDCITETGSYYFKIELLSTYKRNVTEHTSVTAYCREDIIYPIYVSSSASGYRSPLTINEVVERLLITAETVRSPSDRKYILRGKEDCAVDITSMDAPEFSFADGSTLKENLEQIAKVLHAKIRMRKLVDTNQYEVWFDPLTTNTKATVTGTLIGDHTAFSAEKYAGTLHTAAQNLTIFNGYEGGISEPFGESQGQDEDASKPMKTLRCADSEARICEDTGEIETLLPIKRILSLKMKHDEIVTDITKYVREKSVYQGLSSFDNEQSRSYYLYYTIGEKNIKGLFEKLEDSVVYDALKEYAITNIFNNGNGTVSEKLTNYQDLLFYIEYEPYMNIHLVSSRVDGRGTGVAYIANQTASEVDKDSLSDFSRGTIEQMSSESPKKTYLIRSLDKVPTVGTMYDDQNYISEVSFEIYPYFVKCTITISEHYNRLGQRVEVANAIRQYEIDINNVRERHVLYTDVCNISFAHDENAMGSILSDAGKKRAIRHAADSNSVFFTDGTASLARITTFACPHTKNIMPDASQARKLQTVNLPVLSFGFGNSLVFSIPFKDNFSAGSRAVNVGKDDVKYNMNEYVQYGDIYGAAELMKFSLHNGACFLTTTGEETKELGRNIPLLPDVTNGFFTGGMLGTKYADTDDEQAPYIYLFKDGREKITFTYQLLFQSDSGIIIGNDFAKTSPLVTDYFKAKELQDFERGAEFDPNNTLNSLKIHFYGDGYGDPSGRILHPITGTTVTSDKKSIVTLDEEDGKLWLAPDFVYAHDSWAILRFGKFMLGSNSPFPTDGKLYFNYSHK